MYDREKERQKCRVRDRRREVGEIQTLKKQTDGHQRETHIHRGRKREGKRQIKEGKLWGRGSKE